LFLFVLPACRIDNAEVRTVTKTTESYYLLLENEDYSTIPSLFSQSFFDRTDTLTLINQLRELGRVHGKVHSAELKNYTKDVVIKGGKKERKLSLYYKVIYEDNSSTGQEFRFFYAPELDTLIDGISIGSY
jgi:hypothetical protein